MRVRQNHILQPSNSNIFPTRLLFFDTETVGTKVQSFKMLATEFYIDYQLKEQKIFYELKEFWGYVISLTKRKTIHILAHHMQFDFLIAQGDKYLLENGYVTSKFFVMENGTTILKFKNLKTKGKIQFIDTFNYFKVKLKKMGETIGLPKLSIDFKKCSKEELEIYCLRDVEILAKFFLKYLDFLKEEKLGSLRYTISSQSFQCFLSNHYEGNIAIHNNQEAINLERFSYKGARTEAFRLGKIKGMSYKLDINKMYNFFMKNERYPIKLRYYSNIDKINFAQVKRIMNNKEKYLVIIDVTIKINENKFGFKQKGRLIFPTGTFRTGLTSPEIALLNQSEIVKIHQIAVYDSAILFKSFCTKFEELQYRFKEEKNDIYLYLAKLFPNTLYGRFGMLKREVTEFYFEDINYNGIINYYNQKDEYEGFIFKYNDKFFLQHKTRVESHNSFPAICAFVTAYARCYMNLFLQKYKGEIYYCDTDSIFCSEKVYLEMLKDGFIDEKELGKWKLEDNGDLTIYGLKDYVFNEDIKIKGIKKSAKLISENTYEMEQFSSLKGQIRANELTKVYVKTVKKTLKRIYYKGIVNEDLTISPFLLE